MDRRAGELAVRAIARWRVLLGSLPLVSADKLQVLRFAQDDNTPG